MPNPYIIVISCVTTETVMVSSPSIFYKADEVHLFRYIRDPGTASAKLYEDHFQSVCKQIRSSLPECLVTEHTDDPVYDLPGMIRALSVLYSRIGTPGCRGPRQPILRAERVHRRPGDLRLPQPRREALQGGDQTLYRRCRGVRRVVNSVCRDDLGVITIILLSLTVVVLP